jgi:hypothetical protein
MYLSHLFAVMPPLLPTLHLLVLIAPLPVCLHASRLTTYLSVFLSANWLLPRDKPPSYPLSAAVLPTCSLPAILPVCLSFCLLTSACHPFFCLLVHMPLTNSNILSDCCCPVCLCLPTHACLLPCCSSASKSWHLSACLSFCQLPLICLLLY